MIRITKDPLDPARVSELLHIRPGTGSVVVHFAVVKPLAEERRTRGIRFTPTDRTEEEMSEMERKLREDWKLDDVLLLRRVGDLQIGEVISVVAAAASGREEAFAAAKAAVSGFKQMVSMQKTELWEAGE